MAEPSSIWGLDALLTEVPITVPGTYQLILRVPATRLPVGALGAWDVDAGVYVYTGSALNGVRQRVLRHLRPGARVRWHIDYLRSVGTVVAIRYVLSGHRLECALHRAALSVPGTEEPIPGFGASDCHCRSHLVRLRGHPSGEEAVAMLAEYTPADLLRGVDRQDVVERHGKSPRQCLSVDGLDVDGEDHVSPDRAAGRQGSGYLPRSGGRGQ